MNPTTRSNIIFVVASVVWLTLTMVDICQGNFWEAAVSLYISGTYTERLKIHD